jgi:hypothetical protein
MADLQPITRQALLDCLPPELRRRVSFELLRRALKIIQAPAQPGHNQQTQEKDKCFEDCKNSALPLWSVCGGS